MESNTNEVDFVLKHRITGAGFLLFFGALFLPWLLGPPSEALKAEEPVQATSQAELSSREIEDELLAVLENQKEDVPEQVYISKITPLNEAPNSGDASNPVGSSKSAETVPSSPEIKSAAVAENENVKAAKDKNVADSKPKKIKVVEAKRPVVNASPVIKKVAEPDKVVETEKVGFGWVVQVGVFEKPEGVAKELAELRSQGFSPSTSEMETNQKSGKATRIWLGPFGRRVDAAKTKSRLTEKTGKAGYIRAYP